MAVRPLVTTGVALLSAGALVAGTPALFVPRNEITVAASSAESPVQRTMTAEQINLVALSLQGALGSFLDGYGGYYYQGSVTATAYVKDSEGKLVEAVYDKNGTAVLYDADGYQLYGADVNGNLVTVTTANLNEDGSPVQFYWGNGYAATEADPGNCSATGAVCHDGFTGLAYYLSDNVLPLDIVDNIFFEGGVTEFAYLGSVVAGAVIDAFDPTQRLQLSKRVDEFFSGGAAYVAYSIINDNLPDDAIGALAKGLNAAFYSGGVVGAVTYVIDVVKELTNPAEPEEDAASVSLLSAVEKTGADTPTESSVTSTSLPSLSKLLSLPTPKLDVESPFKKLMEGLEAPAETKLVSTLEVKTEESTVDEAAESGTETVTPVEVTKPAAPKFELPKLDLGLNLTPKTATTVAEVTEVKEAAAEEKSAEEQKSTESKPSDAGSADAGAATKTPNKFAPKSRTTERKKSAGEKFVENATKSLEKAFKPTTKAGAGKQENAKSDAAKGDTASASGAASGATAGNAHSDTKDNKGAKDNKDK